MSTARSSKILSLKSIFKKELSELVDYQHWSSFLSTNTNKNRHSIRQFNNSKMIAVWKWERDLYSKKKKNLLVLTNLIFLKIIFMSIKNRSTKAKIKKFLVLIQLKNGELKLEAIWSRRRKYLPKKKKLKRQKLINIKHTRKSLSIIQLSKVLF